MINYLFILEWKYFMENKVIPTTLTAIFSLLAILHIFIKDLNIDLITIILIIIAFLPWLMSWLLPIIRPYINTIEIGSLGGLKITLTEIQKALGTTTEEQQSPTPQEKPQEYSYFEDIVKIKPALTLVAIRIEIEQLINRIPFEYFSQKGRNGLALRRKIELLARSNEIPSNLVSILTELIILGNQAAHGASVDEDAAKYAINISYPALTTLKNFISDDNDNSIRDVSLESYRSI